MSDSNYQEVIKMFDTDSEHTREDFCNLLNRLGKKTTFVNGRFFPVSFYDHQPLTN